MSGKELRKVTLLPGNPRGGMLTQGSALLVTSNPDRTSPVKRGLFVLANFLGTPPSATGQRAGARGQRKRIPRNCRCATCSSCIARTRVRSCHNRMDPIGLAFENFNGGMWRDSSANNPSWPRVA